MALELYPSLMFCALERRIKGKTITLLLPQSDYVKLPQKSPSKQQQSPGKQSQVIGRKKINNVYVIQLKIRHTVHNDTMMCAGNIIVLNN